jgi:hypothetical protein
MAFIETLTHVTFILFVISVLSEINKRKLWHYVVALVATIVAIVGGVHLVVYHTEREARMMEKEMELLIVSNKEKLLAGESLRYEHDSFLFGSVPFRRILDTLQSRYEVYIYPQRPGFLIKHKRWYRRMEATFNFVDPQGPSGYNGHVENTVANEERNGASRSHATITNVGVAGQRGNDATVTIEEIKEADNAPEVVVMCAPGKKGTPATEEIGKGYYASLGETGTVAKAECVAVKPQPAVTEAADEIGELRNIVAALNERLERMQKVK